MNYKVSIFIGLPAYNEEKSIMPLFSKILEFKNSIDQPLIILAHNDGSTDLTRTEILKWADKLDIRLNNIDENLGLGNGLNELFKMFVSFSADGDFLVIMDCDDTQNPAQINEMLKLFDEKKATDIVIASRYQSGSKIQGLARHRVYLSQFAALLYKLIHPYSNVRDYTCGFRMYRRSIVNKVMDKYGLEILSEKNFSCMVELLLKMGKAGALFEEIPLKLAYDQKLSDSKMNVSANSIRLLRNLLVWKFRGF